MNNRVEALEREALAGAVGLQTDVGRMLFHGHDRVITPAVRDTGAWEPHLSAALGPVVRPGMVVAVVGAHVGYFVRVVAGLVGPSGRVTAIEPEPANLALLRANVRDAAAPVRVIAAAAWATSTRLPLTRCIENTGDHRIAVRARQREVIEVDAVTLDQVLDHGVDVILLDMQGTEHLALRGAGEVLSRHRPLVFAEFWPAGLEEAGTDPLDVLRGYREAGLRVRLLEGVGPTLPDDAPAEALLQATLAIDPERFGTLILDRAAPRRLAWRLLAQRRRAVQ